MTFENIAITLINATSYTIVGVVLILSVSKLVQTLLLKLNFLSKKQQEYIIEEVLKRIEAWAVSL